MLSLNSLYSNFLLFTYIIQVFSSLNNYECQHVGQVKIILYLWTILAVWMTEVLLYQEYIKTTFASMYTTNLLVPDLSVIRQIAIVNVLLSLQESGVKVYVLLYNDIEKATDLDSDHAEKVLEALHPNVAVGV